MEDLRNKKSKAQLNNAAHQQDPLDTFVERIAKDETTGSGYSKAERSSNDATNTNHPANPQHTGSRDLIDKYNINDQAHSDSSKKDFVKTISKNIHSDGSDGKKEE